MKTEFDLLISFRTPDGFKPCGQYFLGDDREFTESLFGGLRGRIDVDNKCMLHLDLVETCGQVPVKVKSIGCNFSELCGNCQQLTRALFREYAIKTKTGV